MRWSSVRLWLSIVVLLGVGGVALAQALSGSTEADRYRRALPCGGSAADPGACYHLTPGTILSVSVSQSRSGERDAVVISTPEGPMTATLEPSDANAEHVRTGAQVLVETYRGAVTEVQVDGRGIPSSANPVHSQRSWFVVAAFVGIPALLFGAMQIYALTRRRRVAEAAATSGATSGSGEVPTAGGALQTQILDSGRLGVVVKPSLSTVGWRFGLGGVMILAVSARWLVQARTAAPMAAFDTALIAAGGVAIALVLRNSRLIGDRQSVGRADLLGRTTWHAADCLARAERFGVRGRYGVTRYLALIDTAGTTVVALSSGLWDLAQVEALYTQAGVPLTGSYDDLVSAFRINSRAPGATSWWKTLAILGVMAVVVIVFVVITIGSGTR